MQTSWNDYQRTLAREVGEDLASEFTAALRRAASDSQDTACRLFFELGCTWSSLLKEWGHWNREKSKGEPIGLVLRDAKPLQHLKWGGTGRGLYLNRKNCGISDEISGDAGHSVIHGVLKKYMEQNGCPEHFMFVDSGCYGTIVLELHGAGMEFHPLFFFSKNPNIPGFLNEIGLSESEGELLNDSLECAFPNVYQRPSRFVERCGIVQPDLKLNDDLSVQFGKASLAGLEEGDKRTGRADPLCEARRLLDLSIIAREGSFTGLLPRTTPEWSQKQDFLANWPKELCWT